MEGDAKKLVWTIGAQMIALTIGLLTIALIVWIAGKAWKKSQAESNWAYQQLDPNGFESGYNANAINAKQNWLGY